MKSFKYFSIATIFTVGLGGCGTLSPYDLNPTRTQSNTQVRQFTTSSPTISGADPWVSTQGRFRKALIDSSAAPQDGTKATIYLESGMAAADMFCRQYFQRLGEQRADNIAGRGAFNVADAATSAALGLAGASANVVAGTSVGFSTVESLFETVDNAYLVSPEVHQVQALVFSARDTLHQKIYTDSQPSSYPEAERRLGAYHDLCTFNGIKRLVGEAVTTGTPMIENGSDNLTDADGGTPKGVTVSGIAPSARRSVDTSLTVRIR